MAAPLRQPRGSVFRGALGAVDDDDVERGTRGFEREAELLADGSEERFTVRGRRNASAGDDRWQLWSIAKLKSEFTGEVCPIDHRAPGVRCEPRRQLR